MSKDIGETAGVIWKYLDERGEATITSLVKDTKLSQRHADPTVRWLAREGKIQIRREEKKELISLS